MLITKISTVVSISCCKVSLLHQRCGSQLSQFLMLWSVDRSSTEVCPGRTPVRPAWLLEHTTTWSLHHWHDTQTLLSKPPTVPVHRIQYPVIYCTSISNNSDEYLSHCTFPLSSAINSWARMPRKETLTVLGSCSTIDEETPELRRARLF